MPPENIVDEFDVHLNQIWYTTILRNYESVSVYEWQSSVIKLRETAIDLITSISQYVDSLLEGNNSKSNLSLQKIEKYINLFHTADLNLKPYPSFNKKYYEYSSRTEKEKGINSWLSSLRNVSNQITGFFIPKAEHNRHIALYNLRATYLSIDGMQKCFISIVNDSFEYFDISSLEIKERERYERLYITMQYYVSQIPLETKQAVRVAKNVAKEWWERQEKHKIERVKEILEEANYADNYTFYPPYKLEITEALTSVTIGVDGLDWSDEASFQQLIIDLVDFAEFEADFFTILNVRDRVVLGGLRFQQDFFKSLKAELNGETLESVSNLTPLPVFPDKQTLQTIKGLTLPSQPSEDTIYDKQFQVLIELWKLYEYRARLCIKSEIESKWLKQIEDEIIPSINKHLNSIEDIEFNSWVSSAILNHKKLSMKIIIERINNLMHKSYRKMEISKE